MKKNKIEIENCPICSLIKRNGFFLENSHAIAYYDKHSNGENMVVSPKKHDVNILELSHEEIVSIRELLGKVNEKCLKNKEQSEGKIEDYTIVSHNLINTPHLQIKIIPRKIHLEGDLEYE